jgi:phenylalanine-4-hydroxylase
VATDDTPPPSGAAADWTIPQRWESYMRGEHTLWNQLFVRQPSSIKTQWPRQLCKAAA